ncbi:MAG: cell division protein FtsA [Bacteroidales bacterium]|nr:cell division protein FtsA [Bacteroidales bacterium]
MEEKNIVAIDLGTSKIALTVASVSGEDVQIVYYKEMPSHGIKYSSVYNILHVTEPLGRIIKDAEEALDIKITQAVIGMPKYPVRQESNSGIIKDRGEDADITAEDIADLKSYAEDSYPLENPEKEAIYGAVAQSFSDGENFQIIENDIIGMASDTLEGHFKIFIGKKSDLKKIDTVMSKTGMSARKKYFTADTTAKAVLTASEMENGVALIDFGGGSTSVSIYHGSIMRHYASIPFGGKNITDDIKSECQISERLAENIKLAYGACMPEKLQSLSEKVLHIRSNNAEPDKQVTVKYLSEIITARIEEIMMAMLYEINESGFADSLRSGIVITGGCAQTANLGNFIYELSGYRVRTGYPQAFYSNAGCDGLCDTSAATSIGLILAAKDELSVNCAIASETSAGSIRIENEDIPMEGEAKETEEDPKEPENGQLFRDSEIEKIDPPKKKKKDSIIKVLWTKAMKVTEEAKEKTGKLLDEISEEEI